MGTVMDTTQLRGRSESCLSRSPSVECSGQAPISGTQAEVIISTLVDTAEVKSKFS